MKEKMKISEIKKLYDKKDKQHNWNHILRIKKKIKILKKPYKKINEDLLNFLILFHGLKDYIKKNKKEFDNKYIKSLLRHNKNPKKIEEKLVFDANMLDNIGKQGIRKALIYGKIINRNKKETYEYLKKNIKNIKFHTIKGKQISKKEIKFMEKKLK